MSNIHILHVEDVARDRLSMNNAASDFNEANEDQIILHAVQSIEEAKRVMAETEIDAAIVDLKLGGDNDSKSPSGLSFVEEIVANVAVVTVIFSGTTGYADDLISEDNLFLRSYRKGETAVDDILLYLHRLYQTGITQLFSRNELINEYRTLLKQIFDKHISSSIEYWLENNDKGSLHRYVHHHIAEYYKIDEDGGLAVYSPAEMYMTPTINPCPHTGDIVLFDGKQHLVVTPACDIVLRDGERNSEFVMMLELEDLTNHVTITNGVLSNNQKNKLKSKLRKHRYYDLPLPKFGRINSCLIDFQKVINISNAAFEDAEIERIASIPESFMKDIIHQFSSYYSRQGAPNINLDSLYNNLV